MSACDVFSIFTKFNKQILKTKGISISHKSIGFCGNNRTTSRMTIEEKSHTKKLIYIHNSYLCHNNLFLYSVVQNKSQNYFRPFKDLISWGLKFDLCRVLATLRSIENPKFHKKKGIDRRRKKVEKLKKMKELLCMCLIIRC